MPDRYSMPTPAEHSELFSAEVARQSLLPYDLFAATWLVVTKDSYRQGELLMSSRHWRTTGSDTYNDFIKREAIIQRLEHMGLLIRQFRAGKLLPVLTMVASSRQK
jgi:hypothetical protein